MQLLDSNIPQQLSILYNTTNTHNSLLVWLYHMLTALFTSYIHMNNIGAEPALQEEEEKQDNTISLYNNNKHKHLLFQRFTGNTADRIITRFSSTM